jgi:laminin, alpha 1/2
LSFFVNLFNFSVTIEELNRYGTNDHHIKLPQAIKDAKQYLDDLKVKMQQFNQSDNAVKCAKDLHKFWTNESYAIESMNIGKDNLKLSLDDLKERYLDLEKHAHRTQSTIDTADETFVKNEERFENLKNKLDEIRGLEQDVDEKLNNSLIAQSETTIEMLKDNMDNIEDELTDILILNKSLNETTAEVTDVLIGIQNTNLPNAQKHAAELMEKANSYTQLFQHTKDGAEIAMLASTAHQNITAAIAAAKLAAQQAIVAAQQADAELNPDDEVSIKDRGIESINESQDIEQEALTEIDKLDGK